MENIRDIVCTNFKRLFEASSLSKREIAHQMGVSESTLQRWKNGETCPEVVNVQKFAEIVGVNPLELYAVDSVNPPRKVYMSEAVKLIASIPDEIYELAKDYGPDDEVWKAVKGVFKIHELDEKDRQARGKKKKA